MHNRKLGHRILTRSERKHGRILVVTGARQTGKTTLVRHTFTNYDYLSIEDPVMRRAYTSMSAAQWKSTYPNAILDEVQKEPLLIESIKSVYDQYDTPRYILLGSSQILLLQKVKESLAGRSQIIELYPLTLPELMSSGWDDNIKESPFQRMLSGEWNFENELPDFMLDPEYSKKIGTYNYYLNFGGYPALTDASLTNEERREWLKNYVRTYLERDVRDLADIRDLEPFIRIQQMVALNTGGIINYSKLAKEASVTSKTAQRYLQYLELSYQAILLNPWFRNEKKRLVRSAKVHILDPGICSSVLQKNGMHTGNEYESAIVAEMFKQAKYTELPINMYHLRTQDGREIDFLIETEKGYYAFEIKMSKNINDTDGRHLRNIDEILDKPVIEKIILSNDTKVKRISGDIICVHAGFFLS